MKLRFHTLHELRDFLFLWSTQSLSQLGSAMTSFAFIIWSYQQSGSALNTALLSICSYAPYVVFSIFAGAISDRWNKRIIMLVSDSFAAICTICVFVLLKNGQLELWHLYILNALNGLMETIQNPASDVASSILTPKKYYQRISGLRSFSNSLVTILTPMLATALYTLIGMDAVILFDLTTFVIAFVVLLGFIKIPDIKNSDDDHLGIWKQCKIGLSYLKQNRGILDLILFLAMINLIASVYNAALPAMVLSRFGGSEEVLGIINTCTGVAMMVGSILVTFLPTPKSRVKVICNTLLFSMSTENFILAFGQDPSLWYIGELLGWLFIPMMNANMDVLFRSRIPIALQGRVYSVRNTLQFFTIPLGYLLGGFLVDRVFEPYMASSSTFHAMLGTGKGSGAALLFLVIGFVGILVCLAFRKDKHLWQLEESTSKTS